MNYSCGYVVDKTESISTLKLEDGERKLLSRSFNKFE
jgi:hypothetical protein